MKLSSVITIISALKWSCCCCHSLRFDFLPGGDHHLSKFKKQKGGGTLATKFCLLAGW